MPIKTKILIPFLMVVLVAAAIAGFIGYEGHARFEEMATLTRKATEAGTMSRRASSDLSDISHLVSDVTAMTRLIARSEIERRFSENATAAESDLARLKTTALSTEMADLAQKAIDRFATWRAGAEILLGLRASPDVPVPEIVKRDGDEIKSLLNEALALSSRDAQSKIMQAGQAESTQTALLSVIAAGLAFTGIAIAFVLSKSISRPIMQLAANAERIAGGDLNTEVLAGSENNEIGALVRAVQIFKVNGLKLRETEAEAARQRLGVERERAANEAARADIQRRQEMVVASVAAGLDRLAKGDLTSRLGEPFSAEYEKLRADFNATADSLQDALRTIVASTSGISSGSDQIATASDDLSRRTEQQAANLEETTAALSHLTKTVNTMAIGAADAAKVVVSARTSAESSGLIVQKAIEAMGKIKESSNRIGNIIGVIDEISFQTNLLALNAGVEAARAGEAGRGFAVVASEVRALAQRSAEAAKEIKGLISASTTQVENGVVLVDKTGSALKDIVAEVALMDELVRQISTSSKEQASGIAEINTAVAQLDHVVQQNAAMVVESTAAAHALKNDTQDLSDKVGKFQIGVSHRAEASLARGLSSDQQSMNRRPVKKVATGGR